MYYCELFVTRLVVDRDKPGNLLLFGLLFVVFYGLRISQDFQLDQFYYHSESQNNLSLEMFSLNMVDNLISYLLQSSPPQKYLIYILNLMGSKLKC